MNLKSTPQLIGVSTGNLIAPKYIYKFIEGDGKNKMLLGGKGANLCEMTQIGLRVPPGFVISTEACLDYIANNRLPDGVMDDVRAHMAWLEQETGKQFGGSDNPLLVSVRSGSSMPGMMDTILNLGLNEKTLAGLIKLTGNERFGYDAYRRFIQLFGKIALNVDDHFFDEHFEAIKRRAGVKIDLGLSAEDLRDIGQLFLQVVQEQTGRPFPQDPYEQLELAIKAVFGSWMGQRAVDYRREFKITPAQAHGTAVNIVTMVFGNMGNDCSTGVGFTRDPGTGENVMYGEYLVNAQGEDVVAGIRTPKPVAEMKDEMPDLYRQLVELRNKLEGHYHEVQDYEYTIEKGVLYCLQTRTARLSESLLVRLKIAVEMAQESMISPVEAIARIDMKMTGDVLRHLLFEYFERKVLENQGQCMAVGIPVSQGLVQGYLAFTEADVLRLNDTGQCSILVSEDIGSDHYGFIEHLDGLATTGEEYCPQITHAAVIARGRGMPCVVGLTDLKVDQDNSLIHIGDQILNVNDPIVLDGATGKIYKGHLPAPSADEIIEFYNQIPDMDKSIFMDVHSATSKEIREFSRSYPRNFEDLCKAVVYYCQLRRWQAEYEVNSTD